MFACKSDNTAGRCQARRPGRLLEATCKRCPRGMAVTYRLRKQAVPYKTRLTGRLMPLRMRGSAQTRRTPRHFMPCFIGILKSVPTSVPTIRPGPIFDVKAQKDSLNHLDDPHACNINPGNSSRPALLVPAKCSVFRSLFTGMPAQPVSGDPDARRLPRCRLPGVTGSRPVHIKGNGQLRIGGPFCNGHTRNSRLSAPLAPGECSGSARRRRWR